MEDSVNTLAANRMGAQFGQALNNATPSGLPKRVISEPRSPIEMLKAELTESEARAEESERGGAKLLQRAADLKEEAERYRAQQRDLRAAIAALKAAGAPS